MPLLNTARRESAALVIGLSPRDRNQTLAERHRAA